MTTRKDYSEDDETLEMPAEVPSTYETIQVMFNQNRSFELKIGRKMFFFSPYSTETLTKDEFEHPDFKQQSRYFNVKI